ncbi:MAG: response regulator [Proteobacteria bacterium]|nr:response regulator [Pseudomonadota bacterium]
MNRKKILLVEDEFIVAEHIRGLLEEAGYGVVAVTSSGEDAVRVCDELTPDLVLMDVMLAGEMDGTQAAEILRREQGLPIIFLTAFTDESILAKAKSSDPFGYLVKPVGNRELRTTIEMALYKAELEKRLRESERRFRLVADFTHDWEIWIGRDGGFEYMSPSCLRITGYGREAFTADPDLYLRIVHPEDREIFSSHHRDEYRTMTPGAIEFRILTREGEERWISHLCRPVYDERERFMGKRISNRDVTVRKRAETEREDLIVQLQEALARVKTLSGLLPICSNCKKIRDDQGYWLQLESYIHDHSEARFSHGICPECSRKLYPFLFEDQDGSEPIDP